MRQLWIYLYPDWPRGPDTTAWRGVFLGGQLLRYRPRKTVDGSHWFEKFEVQSPEAGSRCLVRITACCKASPSLSISPSSGNYHVL